MSEGTESDQNWKNETSSESESEEPLLHEEIVAKTNEVLKAYQIAGEAFKNASESLRYAAKKVDELKGLLPDDMCIQLPEDLFNNLTNSSIHLLPHEINPAERNFENFKQRSRVKYQRIQKNRRHKKRPRPKFETDTDEFEIENLPLEYSQVTQESVSSNSEKPENLSAEENFSGRQIKEKRHVEQGYQKTREIISEEETNENKLDIWMDVSGNSAINKIEKSIINEKNSLPNLIMSRWDEPVSNTQNAIKVAEIANPVDVVSQERSFDLPITPRLSKIDSTFKTSPSSSPQFDSPRDYVPVPRINSTFITIPQIDTILTDVAKISPNDSMFHAPKSIPQMGNSTFTQISSSPTELSSRGQAKNMNGFFKSRKSFKRESTIDTIASQSTAMSQSTAVSQSTVASIPTTKKRRLAGHPGKEKGKLTNRWEETIIVVPQLEKGTFDMASSQQQTKTSAKTISAFPNYPHNIFNESPSPIGRPSTPYQFSTLDQPNSALEPFMDQLRDDLPTTTGPTLHSFFLNGVAHRSGSAADWFREAKTHIYTPKPLKPEDHDLIEEFIKYATPRLDNPKCTQSHIAEEIIALSNSDTCKMSQGSVSTMMRRIAVPKPIETRRAIQRWIDKEKSSKG
ncbi:hypothetical protein G9A89_007420 [Geosiphon pyriformis]|nr:hypothetical protein G9A89_007420 [Geosiphon pyriformis]